METNERKSDFYVPGRYTGDQRRSKKTNNNPVIWFIVIVLCGFTIYHFFFKDKETTDPTASQNYPRWQSETTSETGLTRGDIMKRYFPLSIGNTWAYKRTLIDPDNVFSYTEKTTTEAGWDIPEGVRYFTVGKSLFGEKKGVSHETYTITSKDENNCFSIQIKGSDNPRDGRYEDIYASSDDNRNIRWKYVSKGVWEILDGRYADTKTRDQIWSVILDSDILISNPSNKGEIPSWIIGSTMYDNKISVPAGTFANCLENVTVVGGSNIEEIIKNNSPIRCKDKDGFGCFITKSYYAKDIGLILEIQFDKDNNIVYKLELEDYKIN